MPFNFKLKKSRQYNVTSKDLFVITVYHLVDATPAVDCTLDSKNTGQECLENVCLRLGIIQSDIFGLRYIKRGTDDEQRWIDLDRPLSRQLEKHAGKQILFFRVMFYVSPAIKIITDKESRNYFYLQLKSDVVEGKLNCDLEQAIILASYCRQNEYDANQREQQTVDTLKTLLPYPKHMVDFGLLEKLTEEVLNQYGNFINLTQSAAEENFITACEEIDGYGQEKFNALNRNGNEVTIGITFSGIAISNDVYTFYPWPEITNIANQKRGIYIVCIDPEKSVAFELNNIEVARYVWKLCVLQHKMHKKYIENGDSSNTIMMTSSNQSYYEPSVNNSREDLLYVDQMQVVEHEISTWSLAEHEEQQQIQHQQQHHHHLQLQQQQQQQQQQQLAMNNNHLVHEPEMIANIPNPVDYARIRLGHHYGSSNILDKRLLSNQAPQIWNNNLHCGSNNSINNNYHHHQQQQVHSSSCIDLSSSNVYYQDSMLQHHHPAYKKISLQVPLYRPAPDYETAVQQKYRASNFATVAAAATNTEMLNNISSKIVSDQHLNDYANFTDGPTGDVYQVDCINPHIRAPNSGLGADYLYPDVTQTTSQSMLAAAAAAEHQGDHHYITGIDGQGKYVKVLRLRPTSSLYPVNRINSTSTPDLALTTQYAMFGYRPGVYVSGSSPDLVSSRYFMRNNLINIPKSNPVLYPKQEMTVDGIRLAHSSHNMIPSGGGGYTLDGGNDPSNYTQQLQPSNIQNVYENNKYVYWQPTDYQNAFIQPAPPSAVSLTDCRTASQQQMTGDLTEPIYENLPVSVPSSASTTNEMDGNFTTSVYDALRSKPPAQTKLTSSTVSVAVAAGGGAGHSNDVHVKHVTLSSGNNRKSSDQLYSTKNPVNLSENNNGHNHQQLSNKNSTAGVSSLLNQSLTSYRSDLNSSTATSRTQSSQHSSPFSVANSLNGSGGAGGDHGSDDGSLARGRTHASTEKEETKRKPNKWNILSRGKFIGSKNSGSGGSSSNSDKKGSSSWSRKNKGSGGGNNVAGDSGQKNQSLPGNIDKEKLCQILESKLLDDQLSLEFERIPKRRENARFDCASNAENKLFNLDSNFLPYDDNRVKITPSRDNRLGYVNASHVTMTVGNNQRFYILAQSPQTSLTCNNFWKCVWETDVYLIIQLSDYATYLPKINAKPIDYGSYQVWCEFQQETERCITSKLRLYHIQNRRYRSVWHLSYLDWDTTNCPNNVVHYLDFLEEFNSVRLASVAEVPTGHNTNPPVLIHCGGGCGRSGLTLAADLFLYILDHNQSLNIPDVIKKLCEQREHVIPSLAQYQYIFALLVQYLKRNRLI